MSDDRPFGAPLPDSGVRSFSEDSVLGPIRLAGLFQKRIDGDDALLHLARLRFAQAGLAAEVYAGSFAELDHVLGFVDTDFGLPIVHLRREINLLHEDSRSEVAAYAQRFSGRTFGLVVHDHAEMRGRTDDLITAVQQITASMKGAAAVPYLFLEYAAGLELDWFVEVGERLRNMANASLCLDIGHIGIWHARRIFARTHAGLDIAALRADDPRLPTLVDDVQAAVASALAAVQQTTTALARLGKTLHFHLHDGHPLVNGLSDHFGFLTQLPIPFAHQGRYSLDPLYGPSGARQIIATALAACGREHASFTLEIHDKPPGRLPLGDDARLFANWTNPTNAERMNNWLSVLAQNSMLVAGH